MPGGWEKVLTVHDVHDGPVFGVANFQGRPHIYRRVFSATNDEYSDDYQLMAIDSDLLSLVMEDWLIWQRWRRAFDDKRATLESHPALPEDRKRHETLKNLIGDRFRIVPEEARLLRARFRKIDEQEFEVKWNS